MHAVPGRLGSTWLFQHGLLNYPTLAKVQQVPRKNTYLPTQEVFQPPTRREGKDETLGRNAAKRDSIMERQSHALVSLSCSCMDEANSAQRESSSSPREVGGFLSTRLGMALPANLKYMMPQGVNQKSPGVFISW